MQSAVEAGETGQEDASEVQENKYLTFWTDNELFGIPISDVVQIISMQGITPLPDFPEYAKGVINLRGDIIPVIDIRIRFGKPEVDYTDNTCIIVTNIEDSFMGFIVDAVDEVTDLDEDSISPPPKVSKDITNRYLTGIGQIGDKVVLLLDVAKILSEDEMAEVHETAAQSELSAEPEQPQDSKQSQDSKQPQNSKQSPDPKRPQNPAQPKTVDLQAAAAAKKAKGSK